MNMELKHVKYETEIQRNIKKQEREKDKLQEMLNQVTEGDEVSRNALTTAIEMLNETIKQLKVLGKLSDNVMTYEEDSDASI